MPQHVGRCLESAPTTSSCDYCKRSWKAPRQKHRPRGAACPTTSIYVAFPWRGALGTIRGRIDRGAQLLHSFSTNPERCRAPSDRQLVRAITLVPLLHHPRARHTWVGPWYTTLHIGRADFSLDSSSSAGTNTPHNLGHVGLDATHHIERSRTGQCTGTRSRYQCIVGAAPTSGVHVPSTFPSGMPPAQRTFGPARRGGHRTWLDAPLHRTTLSWLQ